MYNCDVACKTHRFGAPRASDERTCPNCEGLRLAELDRRKGVALVGGFKRKMKAVAKVETGSEGALLSDYSVKEDRETLNWFERAYVAKRGEFLHVEA